MLENLLESEIFSKIKKIGLSIHKNRYGKSFHDKNDNMLMILTSNKQSNVFWFFMTSIILFMKILVKMRLEIIYLKFYRINID